MKLVIFFKILKFELLFIFGVGRKFYPIISSTYFNITFRGFHLVKMQSRLDIRYLYLPKFGLIISRDFRITENVPIWKDQTYINVNFSRKEIDNDKHTFSVIIAFNLLLKF